MESSTSANPIAALFSFWVLIQLMVVLAVLLGGIYGLFCLSRVASSLDRIASTLEAWDEGQKLASGGFRADSSMSSPVASVPPYSVSPPPFTPVTSSPPPISSQE